MLLSGTHELVDRYRRTIPPGTGGGMDNWHRFLRQHPFLKQLLHGPEQPDLGRSLVGRQEDVDGVPVEIMELTGEPGDVAVTHLHVYHAVSPNVSGRPRQMLGKAIGATAAGHPPDGPR